jgi:hypothetical protein
MNKLCTKCNIKKSLDSFNKSKTFKDGLNYICRECSKKHFKEYYYNNKKLLSEKAKIKYKSLDKSEIRVNNEKNKQARQIHYIENKEKIQIKHKIYYEKNKDRILEKQKIYNQNNSEIIAKKCKEYRIKNKKIINEKIKKKKKTNPLYKLTCSLRSRISTIINKSSNYKKSSIKNIIGCSYEEVKQHIENQFVEGMTWENHGLYGWHIDHIIPLKTGKTEEEIKNLCHYTNLQPLWAKDNLQKGIKIIN